MTKAKTDAKQDFLAKYATPATRTFNGKGKNDQVLDIELRDLTGTQSYVWAMGELQGIHKQMKRLQNAKQGEQNAEAAAALNVRGLEFMVSLMQKSMVFPQGVELSHDEVRNMAINFNGIEGDLFAALLEAAGMNLTEAEQDEGDGKEVPFGSQGS